VEELAAKVAPDHLARPDIAGVAPPPAPAPCSEEVMAEWMRSEGLPTDLSTESLRAVRGDFGWTLWQYAAHKGRIDMCEFLKSRGLLDMIEEPGEDGATPLHIALLCEHEGTARWLIDNAANVNAITKIGETVFCRACAYMSPRQRRAVKPTSPALSPASCEAPSARRDSDGGSPVPGTASPSRCWSCCPCRTIRTAHT